MSAIDVFESNLNAISQTLGWSQKEMARQCDISASTVRTSTGARRSSGGVRMDSVASFARGLDVSPPLLFFRREDLELLTEQAIYAPSEEVERVTARLDLLEGPSWDVLDRTGSKEYALRLLGREMRIVGADLKTTVGAAVGANQGGVIGAYLGMYYTHATMRRS